MSDRTASSIGLAGMAGRFIAETNAFLARYWGEPQAGWPRKSPSQDRAPPRPAIPRATATAGGQAMVGLPATIEAEELLARIRQVYQLVDAEQDGGGGPVYAILVLVPADQAHSNGDALRRSGGDIPLSLTQLNRYMIDLPSPIRTPSRNGARGARLVKAAR